MDATFKRNFFSCTLSFSSNFYNVENMFIVLFSDRKFSKLFAMKTVSVRQKRNPYFREVPLFVLGLIFICQIY